MGEIILRKVKGMNWMAKISLVLIFTLIFTTFMYQGWYKPKPVQAAITTVTGNAWSQIYTNTNAFPGTVAYTVNAGTRRMLVVAVAANVDTAGAKTCSVTYGGQSMNQVTSDGGTTQAHTYLFYLNEAGLDAATNSNLVFTWGGTPTAAVVNIFATVYDGVDQSASPIGSFVSGTGTTSVALPSNLTIATGEQAVEVVNMSRTGAATYRTITTPAAGWTQVLGPLQSNDGTMYNSSYILTDSTAGTTNANHTISSGTASIYAMSAMSIKPYTCSDPSPSTITIAGGQTANGGPFDASVMKTTTGNVGSFEYKVSTIGSGTPTARTYYMWADNTTNLGVDGTANLPAGVPSGFTGYPAKTTLGTTEQGTASRYYPAGMTNGSTTVVERLYGPVYANPVDVSNISASMGVRGQNATDTVRVDLYDYYPAGAAGNKTPVASGTAKVIPTPGTTVQMTWTAADFTISGTGRVAQNHRLLVETTYYMGGATTGVRFYFGATGTTASTNITVTETPQVETVCTNWTSNSSIPATTAGGSLCGNYVNGGTYMLDVRGTDPDCGDLVTTTPTNFTWNACSDPDPGTLTTTAPTSGSIVSGTQLITVTVGGELNNPELMAAKVTIAGSDSCNVANAAMSWNSGASRWQYSWNTSACGTVTTDTGVSISVSGTDPDCSTAVSAAQVNNITIDNRCAAVAPSGLAAGTVTTTSIPLTWTHPTTNVDYYNVYRDAVKISTDGTVPTGSFTDSGPLTPSTTYSYYVKGYYITGSCEGPASSTVIKSTLAVTPGAPTVSNVGDATTVSVAVGTDTNSTEATYAIRINGGAYTNQYVNASGGVQATAVWASKAAWGTTNVTGLTTGTTYTFDVKARNGNGELVETGFGPSASMAPHAALPSAISSCAGCHGYTSSFTDGTARNNPSGTVVGSHNVHVVKIQAVCSVCHVIPATETSADFGHRNSNIEMQAGATGISNGFYDKLGTGTYGAGDATFAQSNSSTTFTCRNISCHGGNNPTPVWGVGTARCIDCHSGIVSAMNASKASSGAVTQRDQITGVGGEFGLAWGHKKSGRGAVADADCIVCHLEGDYTTQKTSAKHADGYIDLRDPDDPANGENPIKDMLGSNFRFIKFSTSYAAGSRTSTGNTSNNIDNVLTQHFCLACHDSDGALNTTARSNNGGTGTAAMPFGGIALGANYTAANGAIGTQGLIDVKSQFATSNSSKHPVLGPNNRDYPSAARMNDPYKPAGTRGTSGTLSQGVVLNCFDCHNASATATPAGPYTSRTVAAHGNAETIRGIATVTGTPAAGTNQVTFCIVCHAGYDTNTGSNHGNTTSGTAFSASTDGGMTPYLRYGCNICHGSRYTTAVVRPVRAMDVHGSNVVPTGSITKSGRWAAASNNGPIAFIRNSYAFNNHAPRMIGATAYTPACMGGQTGQETSACNRNSENYTVGGTY